MYYSHKHGERHCTPRGARGVLPVAALVGGSGLVLMTGPTGRNHGPRRPQRRGRGPGARRGATRAAILLLLAEEVRNGYQLMQDLEERSGGAWRPSPGSIYPALSQLEDEGLIEAVEVDGKRGFALTKGGREHVAERRAALGTPWAADETGVPGELHELRVAAQGLKIAAFQVGQTGTTAQLTAAKGVLDDARRALYRLLADEADTEA